jgi:SAM-dependent methyltransferase
MPQNPTMPPAPPPRQPEGQPEAWFSTGKTQELLGEIQRMTIPELTRVFGQYGVYLRPTSELAPELSGNMLGTVLSLHRRAGAFDGEIRCTDHELPICSASLSLVYGLFTFESSLEPELFMQEIARVLKPEGVALLIGWNAWSPGRLRLSLAGARVGAFARVERLAEDAGLEVSRRQHLGPVLSSQRPAPSGARARWFDGLRVARMVVLRRHDAALTPLRRSMPAVALRPGMSAGLSAG